MKCPCHWRSPSRPLDRTRMTAGTKRRPELNRRPLRVIPYLRSLSVAGSPLVFFKLLSLLRKLPDQSLTTRPAAEYTQRTARVPSRLPALAGAVRVLATRKERQTISMRGWRVPRKRQPLDRSTLSFATIKSKMGRAGGDTCPRPGYQSGRCRWLDAR